MDEVRIHPFLQLPSLTGMNSINIFVWAVALLSHAACKSFGALLAVRFILGMCEGALPRLEDQPQRRAVILVEIVDPLFINKSSAFLSEIP